MNGEGKCGCPCHKMGGIGIALVGLTFLLGNLGVLSAQVVGIVWPSLLILGGLKCCCKGKCKCCKEG